MNTCGYTVLFMFDTLNKRNQYSCLTYETTTINIFAILYVIFEFTNRAAGFYVTK